MCEKCHGSGKIHADVMPGAWGIHPCDCRSVEELEMKSKERMRRLKQRILEKEAELYATSTSS